MIGVLEAEELLILRTQCKHYERQTQLLRQTLRDDFAKAAMQSYIITEKDITARQLADCAYAMADNMLEARK